MRNLISVIIPCYCSERTIGLVVEETLAVFEQTGVQDYEIILVNDGSPDRTYGVIADLSRQYPHVIGVDLAKNCGQHNAILAGMHYARGELILGMDDDLQTHPSQIP